MLDTEEKCKGLGNVGSKVSETLELSSEDNFLAVCRGINYKLYEILQVKNLLLRTWRLTVKGKL